MSESADASAPGSAPAPSAAPPTSTISAERKRELLLEARRDRVAWVDTASVPFRSVPEGWGDASAGSFQGGGGDGMAVLRSARACASMSSAIDVAEALMSPQEAGERVKRLLESEIRAEDVQMAMMTTLSVHSVTDTSENGDLASSENGKVEEKKEDGRKASAPTARQLDDNDFIASYCAFLHKLRTPECAELVQGMRRFVHSFEDSARASVARKKKKRNDAKVGKSTGLDNENDKNDDDINRLVTMIQAHIKKTFDAVKSHPQWRVKGDGRENDASSDENLLRGGASFNCVKQSLETFVFGKCHNAIWSYLTDDNTAGEDAAVRERLAELQFITPEHLDMHCLTGSMNDGEKNKEIELDECDKDGSEHWLKYFSAPIQALQSVDRQYSPSRMLYCIHEVYRGVNEALSSAMVYASESGATLPGADDVLPALILVVLCAQPRRIVSNLRFIDLFATPEQLRGEAGYAFTNLFSAVQFLRDLDVDQEEGSVDRDKVTENGVASLSITAEEFRTGLEKCRQDAKMRIEENRTKDIVADAPDETGEGAGSAPKSLGPLQSEVSIPIQNIQSARLQGEVVDFGWARRWQESHDKLLDATEATKHTYGDILQNGEHNKRSAHQAAPSLHPPPLPEGFSRSYTFLAMDADDIRISDIPQLLNEYQMLVRATESLLAERNAKLTAEHKKQIQLTRDKLESTVKELGDAVSEVKK